MIKIEKEEGEGTWQQIGETGRRPVTRVGDNSSISKPNA